MKIELSEPNLRPSNANVNHRKTTNLSLIKPKLTLSISYVSLGWFVWASISTRKKFAC